MCGKPFSSDSDARWKGLVAAAGKLGIAIRPELVVTLTRDISSPELGYPVVQQLLATGKLFTALAAFNDISVIGVIRALQDANLRVPTDVSVIGCWAGSRADSHCGRRSPCSRHWSRANRPVHH
jgi:DNA-binding LacI/PurR family transcriptional regulator